MSSIILQVFGWNLKCCRAAHSADDDDDNDDDDDDDDADDDDDDDDDHDLSTLNLLKHSRLGSMCRRIARLSSTSKFV